MNGYIFQTEQEAIEARKAAADYKGYPVEGGTTLYWVDYAFSNLDNFYYITHVEGLEEVLGEPIEFDITTPEEEL